MNRLRLTNFQTHAHLDLPLSEITSVTGPSDTGKSAILRALRWVVLNDLRGSDFIRWGQKECAAELVLDSGHTIRRGRKGSENYYTLAFPDGKVKEFKAFGSTVPSEIRDLLQASEINFQSQHDSPFWFGLSDGEVGRRLNEIVDLSLIDKSLSRVGQSIRQHQATLTIRIADLAQARVDGERYDHVAECQSDLEPIEAMEARASQLIESIEEVETLLQETRAKRKECREVPSFAAVEEAFAKVQAKKAEITNLVAAIDEVQDLESKARTALAESKTITDEYNKATETLVCPQCQKKVFWLS